MTRRAVLGGLLGGAVATPWSRVAGQADQANFVVIVLDDMRATDWQALPKTRDRLGGTFFENHFVTTPLCAPSRTSILTGQHTHNHQVWDISPPNGGWAGFKKRKLSGQTIAVALQAGGWQTALAGKFMNNYNEVGRPPIGWDQWAATRQDPFTYSAFSFNVNGKKRSSRKGEYIDQEIGKYAVRQINGFNADQPFFLHVGFKANHTPLRMQPKPYRSLFSDVSLLPLRGTQLLNPPLDAVQDMPKRVRRAKRQSATSIDVLERKRLRSVAVVDDQIIKIVDAIAARGELARTYFFMVSDNGWLQGTHGLVRKIYPYDGSARNPLLVSGPTFGSGSDARLVANIDIAPTIAAIAGVSLPAADGRDLRSSARDAVLLESQAGLTYSAIRTGRYLYVENASGEQELYDYQTDEFPEQNNQLADWLGQTPTADPAVVADLRARLADLKAE